MAVVSSHYIATHVPTTLVVSVMALPAWSTTALIFRPLSDLETIETSQV